MWRVHPFGGGHHRRAGCRRQFHDRKDLQATMPKIYDYEQDPDNTPRGLQARLQRPARYLRASRALKRAASNRSLAPGVALTAAAIGLAVWTIVSRLF